MELTFLGSVWFATWMTVMLSVFVGIVFFLGTWRSAGWKEALRTLPWASFAAVKFGSFAIAPAIVGAVLAWMGWLGC